MKTLRGQSARVTKNAKGKFILELYANGEWNKPCCYKNEFDTDAEALLYFIKNKSTIHS